MIPIFIITCDRQEALERSMESYHKNIKTPFEIVIHDNGSTYRPTIELLQTMEKCGTKVYWNERINVATDLNNIKHSINDYFKDRPKTKYVVTDCDIALNDSCGDVLEVYSFILDEYVNNINVVGPVLEIEDIPSYYPKKEEVLQEHLNKFWNRPLGELTYKEKLIEFRLWIIDTTFGMYRAGFEFKRGLYGLRVHKPYSAKHLDWYLHPDKLTEDQKYYMNHCSRRISHWSW